MQVQVRGDRKFDDGGDKIKCINPVSLDEGTSPENMEHVALGG